MTLAVARVKPISVTLDDERVLPDSPDRGTFLHHLARYEFAAAQMVGGETVLDAGCGAGYGAELLSRQARHVFALDYSLQAVDYARRHYASAKLSFLAMDAQRLAVGTATMDLVISFEVFEHFPDPDAFLAECVRVLRPNGRLILSTPNQITSDLHMKSIGMVNDFHINLVGLRGFSQILHRHFAEVEVFAQRRKGSRLYATLRALDVFNLRLRLLGWQQRAKLQSSMGVRTSAERMTTADWVFSRRQLRQANSFVAICRKRAVE